MAPAPVMPKFITPAISSARSSSGIFMIDLVPFDTTPAPAMQKIPAPAATHVRVFTVSSTTRGEKRKFDGLELPGEADQNFTG
jgi:hypothetical protein